MNDNVKRTYETNTQNANLGKRIAPCEGRKKREEKSVTRICEYDTNERVILSFEPLSLSNHIRLRNTHARRTHIASHRGIHSKCISV